jgi:hypothetical protein
MCRINLKGIRFTRAKRGPTSWHRMIRFAARIYKQHSHAQKQKLIDLEALPPELEPKLLEIFKIYLGQEPVLTTVQETLKPVESEIKYDYSKFDNILKKIDPKD